jgi:hypothetical protein
MLSNSQVGTYAYPAQGPSAVRPHAATTVTGAGGTYTLAYDANGNVTTRTLGGTSQAYTWDAENKLAGVLLGAVQHSYLYAADNSRILHVVPNAAGDKITRFLGGGAEIDETGTWTKYVHADVKRTGNGAAAQASYMHRDHLASVRVITDAAGTEVERATYRAFGERARQVVAGTQTCVTTLSPTLTIPPAP